MANPEHLALLKRSVKVWNKLRQADLNIDDLDPIMTELDKADLFMRADLLQAIFGRSDLWKPRLWGVDPQEADLLEVNLRRIDLSNADLRNADLRGADLHIGNLREADLFMADLRGADLREANLFMANLRGADLGWTDLRGANLRGANLREVDLSMADLRWANLNDAELLRTIFSGVVLTEVRGLENCRHGGASIVDFHTLQRSGPLPRDFLRGCGLPDLLIDYLPSLPNQPIQYYSCFISYSHEDEGFAQRLHADLQNKGVRCWFAPEDIKGGRKLYEQIDDAIQLHEKLLLVLSRHSMTSEWVKAEISRARQREVREKRKVLFPIRLVDFDTIRQWKCFDADTGKDSAREIREYFIPDFSNWKSHDAYQQAFVHLLRDLKPFEART
jgi:uncharacterized protein YjbI with pentapeptide repeats